MKNFLKPKSFTTPINTEDPFYLLLDLISDLSTSIEINMNLQTEIDSDGESIDIDFILETEHELTTLRENQDLLIPMIKDLISFQINRYKILYPILKIETDFKIDTIIDQIDFDPSDPDSDEISFFISFEISHYIED